MWAASHSSAADALRQPVTQVDLQFRTAQADSASPPLPPGQSPSGADSSTAVLAPNTTTLADPPAAVAVPGQEAEPPPSGFFSRRFGEGGVPDPRARPEWLYRPYSLGLFLGMVDGSSLIDDWVDQRTGFMGGLRMGWDLDPYWTTEGRIAFGSCLLHDSDRQRAARLATEIQLPQTDTRSLANAPDRYSSFTLYDATLLWYPWGGGRWKPYILTGVGLAQMQFDDLFANHYAGTMITMPLGVGTKYLFTDRVALRLELTDDIFFGGGTGINTVHDLSLTGSLELRFGGGQKNYWPWNPGGQSPWWQW